MDKPIKLEAHGAIDYGLLAANLLGPSALGLKGTARRSRTSSAASRAA